MTIQCQYDLEAHFDHIITFLLYPGITINVSIISVWCASEIENWRAGNSNNRAVHIKWCPVIVSIRLDR